MADGPTIYRRPTKAIPLKEPKGDDKRKWEKHREKKKLPAKIR